MTFIMRWSLATLLSYNLKTNLQHKLLPSGAYALSLGLLSNWGWFYHIDIGTTRKTRNTDLAKMVIYLWKHNKCFWSHSLWVPTRRLNFGQYCLPSLFFRPFLTCNNRFTFLGNIPNLTHLVRVQSEALLAPPSLRLLHRDSLFHGS